VVSADHDGSALTCGDYIFAGKQRPIMLEIIFTWLRLHLAKSGIYTISGMKKVG